MSSATEVLFAVGYNGYGQLNTDRNSSRIINKWSGIHQLNTLDKIIVVPLWSRLLIGQSRDLIISSGQEGGIRKIEFEEEIEDLAANEEICLLLLRNHGLWKIHLAGKDDHKVKVIFLNIEGDDTLEKDEPLLICSTLRGFYAITLRNQVYSIPTRIGSLPEGSKVTKLVAGHEHCLTLLDNGDLFTWGGGLKGQLGVGELGDLEEPTLIEALAGIKIVEIAAGGWQSAAISEFGDLYVWGWNKHGQLGIPVKHRRTIYLLPELIDVLDPKSDDPEEIKSISCGSAHSIILTKSGKLFGTGCTKSGQLSGLESPSGFIDQFQLISPPLGVIQEIFCGPATSFIFSCVPMSHTHNERCENGSSAVL